MRSIRRVVPVLVGLVLLALPAASWAAAPAHLTVGHLSAPVDVENLTAPPLGWQVGAGRQTAYQVQVGTTPGASDVWDSGRVASAENSDVPYGGPALDRANGYSWRVRTWDAAGTPSDWSAPAHFGTGPGATWAGATPIWSAPNAGSWSDYTYTGTFNVTTVAASVSFRTHDTGNFYLWQFRASNAPAEANMLKMHVFVNGSATVLQEVPEPFAIAPGTTYDFKIVTAGATITTYLKRTTDSDWTLANALSDPHFASGGIGFRTGSTESARFGSLRIANAAGDTLYANDFPAGNSDFSGCGTVSGGLLSVGTSKNCVYPPASGWAFLRGDVDLAPGKDIAWAHLYATGASTVPARQFVYKLSLDGHFVGVGPTQPVSGSETRYDGYDVTSLLRPGATNTLGALAYTTTGQQFEALLVVRYADGSTQTFGTGPDWQALNGGAAISPGSYSTAYFTAPQENFNGPAYPFGFDTPGFDASGWPAATVKPALPNLVATPTAKVGRQLERPVSVTEYSPGNYVIDYGRTWVGGLALDLDGTAGQVVDLRYGEVLSNPTTVKYQASAGETYEDKWTLKAGPQHLETWGLHVFRYVNVLNAPPGLTAADFSAEAYVYPFDTSLARFDSSDANLNQVWQLSRNTIEAVNEDIYVDSWERERGEYEADDYLQLLANLYTGGDSTLGTYSMQYLMANRTWPTEWPMYIIQAALETYMQTGDAAPLAQNYATLQKKLPDKWFDPTTGLIHKTTGSNGASSATDDDIVDWPASDRDGYVFTAYNTVINAIGYRSYADMAVIAAALGHADDAAAYQAKADAIHAAVNDRMWDAAAGTYRDGLQNADASPIPHDALQAGVFAVAFGLASPSRAAQVASYIATRGMACSVYCAAFLIQAAYAGDRADVASGLLSSTGTNSWMNMIAQGAGATMEAWTTTEKPNTTYSHPWAASPAFNIPRSMFGIVPTSPGYDTFDIKPRPGTVAWAHITSPSVKGEIGAAFDTVGPRTDVGVWVPANAVARVSVPVPAGTSTVYEDGVPVTGAVGDGFLAVDGVQPGCHVFTTNPGMAPYLDGRLTSVCASPVQVSRQGQAAVGGDVPATLALSLGGPAAFGSFAPGVGAQYAATTAATVTSTAGDATLSVQDPGPVAPGHLVNGAYALAQPLQAAANAGAFAPVSGSPTALLTYTGQVSNDAVTLRFQQAIGANEPLRTGSYGKTLTFTLSTDTP